MNGNTQSTNSDPTIFKTTTGIDYIGVLDFETIEEFIINEMFAVVLKQSEAGDVYVELTAAIHPAMGKINTRRKGCIDQVKLQRSVVIFQHEPNQQLVLAYKDATSIIQIAAKLPGNL